MHVRWCWCCRYSKTLKILDTRELRRGSAVTWEDPDVGEEFSVAVPKVSLTVETINNFESKLCTVAVLFSFTQVYVRLNSTATVQSLLSKLFNVSTVNYIPKVS